MFKCGGINLPFLQVWYLGTLYVQLLICFLVNLIKSLRNQVTSILNRLL